MEEKFYTVERIEGEYAYLRTEGESEPLFIAMALLPPCDVGDTLKCDGLSFELV